MLNPVLCPGVATGASVQGVQASRLTNDEPLDGLKVLDGWLGIRVDRTSGFGAATVAVEYTTAASDLVAGHEIYWQKQAGTSADKATVRSSVDGRTYALDTDLAQDRLLVLSGGGLEVRPGHQASAKIPSRG